MREDTPTDERNAAPGDGRVRRRRLLGGLGAVGVGGPLAARLAAGKSDTGAAAADESEAPSAWELTYGGVAGVESAGDEAWALELDD